MRSLERTMVTGLVEQPEKRETRSHRDGWSRTGGEGGGAYAITGSELPEKRETCG